MTFVLRIRNKNVFVELCHEMQMFIDIYIILSVQESLANGYIHIHVYQYKHTDSFPLTCWQEVENDAPTGGSMDRS